MIAFLIVVVVAGLWFMRRRANASRLAGLDSSAPVHSITVGPRTRRVSPLKGERL